MFNKKITEFKEKLNEYRSEVKKEWESLITKYKLDREGINAFSLSDSPMISSADPFDGVALLNDLIGPALKAKINPENNSVIIYAAELEEFL